VIGAETVDSTGGWQYFKPQFIGTVTVSASGPYTLRVDISAGLFNLNWVDFNVATSAADTDGDGVVNTVDQCPNTPTGIPVDAAGCTLDTDGDGVHEGIDQCPNTPAGTAVDTVGCALPLDSDADGVPDSVDQCPGTPAGESVDSTGCSLFGLTVTGGSSIEFFVNTSAWADVHYRINGGAQQNLRMAQSGGVNTYNVSGLAPGDVVTYFFTYWNASDNSAVDTAWATYTH